jgi:hypothetical protein
MMEQGPPLRRPHRDDRNGRSTCNIWSSGEKDITSLVEYNLGSL